jgi:hypothetical protein
MDRNEFYKEGNKVLTDEEYSVFINAFDDAEDKCNDISSNLREAISGVMAKLWEKRNSTELVTESFTIVNRFGDITITEHDEIMDGGGEISLDDISSIDKLMDILAEMI